MTTDPTTTASTNPPVRRLVDWPANNLRELATTHQTPVYVLDLDRIRQNLHRFHDAFPTARVYYAAKANTTNAVLRTLHDEGAGIECVSAGELDRAQRAGVPPADLLYTAVNPPGPDLDYATDIPDLTITAGARDTIDRLADRDWYGRLCLRVNPGVGAGHHEHVTTGTNPKFGIPTPDVIDTLTDAHDRGFRVVGLHAHAGSGFTNDDLDAHQALVRRLVTLARDSPVSLEFIDIGGGFGVPYHPDDPPLDLDQLAQSTTHITADLDADLYVEPGRYLVADAGLILTRVNTIKPTPDTTVVGVDAGMTTLLRPALYDAYHPIHNLAPDAPDRPTQPVTITGPICESADVLATDSTLPTPAHGDLLAIGNAGAYGWEMTSQYNSRPRPGIIALDDHTPRTVREPETLQDLTRHEHPLDDPDARP